MSLNQRNKIKIEGGMASMTDLVFLLLIFFIIMSLMANNQTPLDLPKAEQNLPTDQTPVEPTVLVLENNNYIVKIGDKESEEVTYEEMEGLITSAVEESGKTKVRIAGHKQADYESVFKVLGLSQYNGWDPVLAYDK
ncbi:biopolymer transporter ExbD [Crocinitomicaceae bacterium]|nr:biopolymer transporter ExbD [Crocinitomicaceae bacterium]